MKINIVVAFRPLSRGGTSSPVKEMRQLHDGRWNDDDGSYKYSGAYRPDGGGIDKDDLIRGIKFLNKNSYFKHNIIVAIDNDVYPNENFLKEFDNVTVSKVPCVYKIGDKIGGVIECTDSAEGIMSHRYCVAVAEALSKIPDDEWFCWAYLSDLIPCKNWDKYIGEAMDQYGDNFVYVPMFVEVRESAPDTRGGTYTLKGMEPSPDLIWNEWRDRISCHNLVMPVPEVGYFTEDDMEHYIKIANDAGKDVILENPGDRIYGIYAVMTMKAGIAKKVLKVESNFDIRFDDKLRDVLHLMKVVCTRSFVFHPFVPFKE